MTAGAHLIRAAQGFLVSVSNPQYWIGLQADGWPNFKWSDSMVPSPLERGGYSNWGTYYNPKNPEQMYVAEPNNLRPSEYCAVGNHTEGVGKPFTWAWADTSCLNSFVSICRINRKRVVLATAAVGAHRSGMPVTVAKPQASTTRDLLLLCLLACSPRPSPGFYGRVHGCHLHPEHPEAGL
jgi:hypothetical protein